jgi:hypothetical protein
MYDFNQQPDDPLYQVAEQTQSGVKPPRSALPLIEPLTEKQSGILDPKPYRILRGVKAIRARVHQNAAIATDGDTLFAWGAMHRFDRSDDARQDVRYTPEAVIDGVLSASVGAWHYMCITKDNRLWGWGENQNGQLGLGDYDDRPEPALVATDVKAVFTGDCCTYIVRSDDSLWRCGLVHNSLLRSDTPGIKTFARYFADVESMSVGNNVAVYVKKNGELWGSGINMCGVLFTEPEGGSFFDTPIPLASGVKNASLSNMFGTYALIVSQSNELYGVGVDTPGFPVTQSQWKKHAPMPIKLMGNISQAYAGHYFSFAKTLDSRLFSFGRNDLGQCGTGRSTGSIMKPRFLMNGAAEATAAHHHGMALQSTGDTWIWGGDYGVSQEWQQAGKRIQAGEHQFKAVSGIKGDSLAKIDANPKPAEFSPDKSVNERPDKTLAAFDMRRADLDSEPDSEADPIWDGMTVGQPKEVVGAEAYIIVPAGWQGVGRPGNGARGAGACGGGCRAEGADNADGANSANGGVRAAGVGNEGLADGIKRPDSGDPAFLLASYVDGLNMREDAAFCPVKKGTRLKVDGKKLPCAPDGSKAAIIHADFGREAGVIYYETAPQSGKKRPELTDAPCGEIEPIYLVRELYRVPQERLSPEEAITEPETPSDVIHYNGTIDWMNGISASYFCYRGRAYTALHYLDRERRYGDQKRRGHETALLCRDAGPAEPHGQLIGEAFDLYRHLKISGRHEEEPGWSEFSQVPWPEAQRGETGGGQAQEGRAAQQAQDGQPAQAAQPTQAGMDGLANAAAPSAGSPLAAMPLAVIEMIIRLGGKQPAEQ